jgi:glc operon protein GlcG
MADTVPSLRLTAAGALKALNAAIDKAAGIGVPQCISVVDAGGHLLAFIRMDGALTQSFDSSLMKAKTAACNGKPTGGLAEGIDLKLAIATGGERINLPGGLPIVVDGHLVGGIGVGSGTGEQDLLVARAGIAAIKGAQRFD